MECDSQTFCLPKLSVGEGGGVDFLFGNGPNKKQTPEQQPAGGVSLPKRLLRA